MYACLVQVVDVMKDNLDKVLERDAKLTTLENRAGKLNMIENCVCVANQIYVNYLIVLLKKKILFFSRHITNRCITIYNKC